MNDRTTSTDALTGRYVLITVAVWGGRKPHVGLVTGRTMHLYDIEAGGIAYHLPASDILAVIA